MMTLVQNIKFQLASAATLFIIMIIWVVIFAEHGLNQDIPAFGSNQSSLVGFVLNNFAFVSFPVDRSLEPALISFPSDNHCPVLRKRVVSKSFHTQSRHILHYYLCHSVPNSWYNRCGKL